MSNFKKLRTILEIAQGTRTMSGASRAYRKSLTSSWKQGEKSGELQQKAAELEKSGGAIAKIHSDTMRKVAKRLRKKGSTSLDTAMRLRKAVPQSSKRRKERLNIER